MNKEFDGWMQKMTKLSEDYAEFDFGDMLELMQTYNLQRIADALEHMAFKGIFIKK